MSFLMQVLITLLHYQQSYQLEGSGLRKLLLFMVKWQYFNKVYQVILKLNFNSFFLDQSHKGNDGNYFYSNSLFLSDSFL